MLAAQQRNDATTLADILEYDVPQLMRVTDIEPSLLKLQRIDALRGIDEALRGGKPIDQAVIDLEAMYGRHSEARGMSAYSASRLSIAHRHDEAERILQVDEKDERRTPATAQLLANAAASRGDLEQTTTLLNWAYARCPSLHNAFIDAAYVMVTCHGAGMALQLARQDETGNRALSRGRMRLAQLFVLAGDLDAAVTRVQAAYASDISLRDGYTELARLCVDNGKPEDAVRLAQRDLNENRLSQNGLRIQAEIPGMPAQSRPSGVATH
jgi:tetratricopeptide (TPR) repeat protein